METLLAIKRSDSLTKTGLDINADTSQKRALLRDEASTVSIRRSRLIEGGFEEVTPGASALEYLPRNSFSRLPHVGAYILRTSEGKRERAEEVFGDDYYLIPDVQLSMPAALGSGALGQNSRQSNWPESSGVRTAHEEGVRGLDVIIAVLDTGCDADHVQFGDTTIDFRYFPPNAPQSAIAKRGFDPEGHGTHVCGIIAGKNTGVAPDATLLVASVIESEKTSTSLRRILAALDWVTARATEPGNDSKAVILNMSLGFRVKDISGKAEGVILDAMHDLMCKLVDAFDILPVVAIGNEGSGTVRYPGAYPEALAVGAVDYEGQPCAFTGGGKVLADGVEIVKPDIAGYGSEIYSSFERNINGHSRYAKRSGTSMAAPYVSAIAALVAQRYGLKGRALRERLIRDAAKLQEDHERVGAGLARYK